MRKTLEVMLNDSAVHISDERKAAMRGFLEKMSKFSTIMALKISLLICEPAEQLAKALPKHNYTSSGAKQSAKSLHDTYASMSEADFERLWTETEEMNEVCELDLNIPEPSRRRAPPKRLGELGGRAEPAQLSLKERLRKDFASVLDWVKSELNRRFDQPGMNQMIQLEKILFAGGPRDSEELKVALGIHATDFDVDKLSSQLKLSDTMFGASKTLEEFADGLILSPTMVREGLLDLVTLLVTLLLTMPATSTTCERSFSGLKRLKTFLRSKMSQSRLTHLLILHIHKQETLKLPSEKIMKEFVQRTPERRKTFGYVSC